MKTYLKIMEVTGHLAEYNKITNIEKHSEVTTGYQTVMKSLEL